VLPTRWGRQRDGVPPLADDFTYRCSRQHRANKRRSSFGTWKALASPSGSSWGRPDMLAPSPPVTPPLGTSIGRRSSAPRRPRWSRRRANRRENAQGRALPRRRRRWPGFRQGGRAHRAV